MSIPKSIIDYFTIIFGSSLARGVALVNTVIIARVLGPKDFGVFSIFYAVMILAWQLPQSFDTVFVAYAKQQSSISQKAELLKAAVALKLIYLGVLLLFSYPLSFVLATYCFEKPESAGPLMSALFCGGCLMFLMTIASIFQEEERFGWFSALSGVYTVLILIGLIALWLTNVSYSLKGVIAIFIGVCSMIGCISVALLWRRIGNLFKVKWNTLSRSFEQGKWIFGVTFVFFLFSRIDVLFLARYVGYEDLGKYSVASQLIMGVMLITGALSGICLPKASAAVISRGSFRAYVRESLWAVCIIELAIAVLLLGAPLIVGILYGSEYQSAGNILRILLLGWICNVPFIPFSFLFYALNDSKTRFFLELTKLVLGIWLLFYLVPLYGLPGAAYAVSLAMASNTVLSFGMIKLRMMHKYKEAPTC